MKVGTIHRFREKHIARMQILLNNKGTAFEEVETDFTGSDIDQQIQISNYVDGSAIPYPLAQVLHFGSQ